MIHVEICAGLWVYVWPRHGACSLQSAVRRAQTPQKHTLTFAKQYLSRLGHGAVLGPEARRRAVQKNSVV